jgi:nucleoid-associated protein YgaU
MIYLDSRYADSDVSYILDARSGIAQATVLRQNPEVDEPAQYGRVYFWKEGDRLDRVSYSFYGSALEWWRIIDANPEILNPSRIAPGTSVRIPQ